MEFTRSKYSQFFWYLFLSVACIVLLYASTYVHYLLFHFFAEIFSIIIACCLFVVSWNTRKYTRHHSLVYLGIAFFFIAILDIFHVLTYKGMVIFPVTTIYYPTQFWIVARFMEAISLLLWLGLSNRKKIFSYHLVFAIYMLITVSAIVWILGFKTFPKCHIDGGGQTLFKIISEYVICGILGGAMLSLYLRRSEYDKKVCTYMYCSILLTILSELSFTLYVDVYGLFNFIGHILKIGSFYMLYKAIIETGLIRPNELIFKRLIDSEVLLNETQQLAGIGGWEYERKIQQLNWTEQVYELHGLSPNELPDMEAAFEKYTVESARRFRIAYNNLLKSGNAFKVEGELLPTDEDTKWIRFSGERINIPGELPRYSGVFINIDATKKALMLKDDIERIIRHDLKNPLNYIIGISNLLREKQDLPEKYRMEMQFIEDSGFRMLSMVNLSQAVYEMEQGRYRIKYNTCDLIKTIRKIIRELTSIIAYEISVINIKTDGKPVAPHAKFMVNCEELLCYSMLGNLIRNAVEASPKKEPIDIDLSRSSGSVIIKIHNIGVVPEDIRKNFFEKYATSGKTTGTGLGTYSAKLVVEAHGGTMLMNTGEESGTIITVVLPDNTKQPSVIED